MNEIDAVAASGTSGTSGTTQTSAGPGTAAGKAPPLLTHLFLQPRFRVTLAILTAMLLLDVLATRSQGLTLAGLDRVLWMTPIAAMVVLTHLLSQQPSSSIKGVWTKTSVALFCLCLLTVFSLAAVVLQDTVISARFDLVDDHLVQIDAAVGFHWQHAYQWLTTYPQAFDLLKLCYALYGWQVVSIPILLACMHRMDDLADFLLLFSVTVVLAILISATIPASNPHIYFGHVGAYAPSEWSQFAALRDGRLHVIDLNDNQGLISLPSLHAAHAVVFAYAVRHLRGWNVGFAVVNVAMAISALPFGGHYLVDILAGITLGVAVIWASRRVSRRRDARIPSTVVPPEESA